jgi:carotenoid cleavage dioxygenase-like enzyme
VLPFNMASTNVGPGHAPFIVNSFHGHWKGLHVVDSKGGIQVFSDLNPFYHVHIANSYENASGITMDLGSYDEIPFQRMAVMNIKDILNKTARDTSYPRSQLIRIHMNLNTQTTTVEKLTDNDRDYDFIKINPAKNGLPYCIYYAVEWYHDDSNYADMAVMKHDTCKGTKLYWNETNVYMNEPFFIANSEDGAEDDGTLVFTANDGKKGKANRKDTPVLAFGSRNKHNHMDSLTAAEVAIFESLVPTLRKHFEACKKSAANEEASDVVLYHSCR